MAVDLGTERPLLTAGAQLPVIVPVADPSAIVHVGSLVASSQSVKSTKVPVALVQKRGGMSWSTSREANNYGRFEITQGNFVVNSSARISLPKSTVGLGRRWASVKKC